jgi:hypothetical protein
MWGDVAGGFAINCNPANGGGSTKLVITPSTETGANPLVGFAALVLTS